MDLEGRVLQVDAVGVRAHAVLVALSEDEFAVLAGEEQIGVVGDGLFDRSRTGLVKVEGRIGDDLLGGGDALVIVTVGPFGFHQGQLLLNGLVIGRDGGVVPILALGSGPEGDAALEAEGGVLGSAILAALPLVGEKLDGFVQFAQDEIPGLLLLGTGDVQADILIVGTLEFIVQGFGHDRNAAIDADIGEIVVRADEVGLTLEGVVFGVGHDLVLLGFLERLEEHVDVTDVGVIPDAAVVGEDTAGIGTAGIGVVGDDRLLVHFGERTHRKVRVQAGHQAVKTGSGAGQVVS